MIFTERTITIRNDSATMNTPVILYRGDKNVEVRFTLVESPFKYTNKDSINIIESTDASYAQLVIKTPNDGDPIFGDITKVGQNTITFVIGSNMIDEIEEVGAYDFQIRLFDEDQTSMVSIPEVVGGFIIKEPIAKEDTTNNITNSANVGYAVVTNDTGIPTFVGDNYNKTTWHDGDVISRQKLNKIEDGIYETYALSKDNSSQIKEKANKNDLEVQKSRIDNLTTLTEGSTTGDAELIDARVGADNIKYNNLGSAIRIQINKIKNQIEIISFNIDDWTVAGLHMGALVPGTTTRITTSGIHYFEKDFTIEINNGYSLVIAKYSNSLESSFISQSSSWETGSIACERGYYRFMIKDEAGTNQGDLAWANNVNFYTQSKFYFEVKDKSIDHTKVTFINTQLNKNLAYLEDKTINATGWSLSLMDQEFTLTRTGTVNQNGMKNIDIPINLKAGTYTFSSANENFTSNIGYLHLYKNDTKLCTIQPLGGISNATFTLDADATVLLKYDLLCDGFNEAIDNNSSIKFNIQIEKGTVATEFVKSQYDLFLDDNINLGNKFNIYQINNLYGKIWNALGDSITAGLGATRPYHNVIAIRNYMTINNYGISGTTIAKSGVSNPMCERYVNMNDNADIITVFGGTNDFGKQVPIGTNDSTDTETFKGALNVLIEGLINKYPGKKIFFFTPIQRGDLINLPIKLIEYVNAMIEICGLWGVPCKDMYRESNLYVRNTFIQNNYFRIDENGNSDKLHPNNEGHKIIADPIEGFIRNN